MGIENQVPKQHTPEEIMNSENFSPMNQKYKKVEDLPKEHQKNFVNVEGGFVEKSAQEKFTDAELIANELSNDGITSIDVLHMNYLEESQEEKKNDLLRLDRLTTTYSDPPQTTAGLNARKERLLKIERITEKYQNDKDFILKAIEISGWFGMNLTEELYADKEFMYKAVNANSRLFERASPELRSDKEFVTNVIKKNENGLLLKHASDELRDEEDIVSEAIQHEITPNDGVFKYASERLHDDADFVIKIMRIGNPTKIFGYVSERLRADKKFVLDAMEKFVGRHYDFAAEIMPNVSGLLRADREFVLEGMKMFPSIIQHASEELRDDKEFMIQAMKIRPYALASASKKLRNDKEVVRGAMSEWTAFSYASEELRSERDFVLEAMRVDAKDLAVASEELVFDREMMIESAKLGGSPLEYYREYKGVPDKLSKLRRDKDFVDELASHNVKILEHASNDLLSDRRFMLEQIFKNKDALKYASKELREEIARLLG